MGFGSLLLLALGLALDAVAAAASSGVGANRVLPRHVLLVAGFFGGSQALMPLLGWAIGSQIGPLVEKWDHWIAFVLLVAIGGKMLWEAHRSAPEAPRAVEDPFGLRVLTLLAIATSIDAFAVGIALPMLDAPFVLSLVTIGVTTAVLSAVGLLLGHRFGKLLGRRLDVVGALVLIGLGTKILIEHLSAV